MTDNTENKVKIRFKFRSGEEFEAEGNPDFIEKQRADFLQLIGKDGSRARRSSTGVQAAVSPVVTEGEYSSEENISDVQPALPPAHTAEPAFYRRKTTPYVPTGDAPVLPPTPQVTLGISAAENARIRPSQTSSLSDERELRLWEQIIRTDDKLVYLRRKSRLLSPNTAALVLIAAAKVLLQATDGYSALALSKSLKKSGYGGERLDRVLGGEMKQGLIHSDGTKRSRLYLLSDEGFARAYVLATKLADEWR